MGTITSTKGNDYAHKTVVWSGICMDRITGPHTQCSGSYWNTHNELKTVEIECCDKMRLKSYSN